jgi:hypothetical protein
MELDRPKRSEESGLQVHMIRAAVGTDARELRDQPLDSLQEDIGNRRKGTII